ncbi:hypothetical protein CHBEV_106 [Choristoneura biennis entomopoxvirus]|uniref:Uncharacterized protein n=1 Tax=Choristoneura biennis entomopoxvirus TaxID=10288 RepID=A0A916KPH9_CBEPV|nr:hypothetical protein CHBEV_106 [Choristoneura biennis entomopoxvirus]CCU55674.1 hypothetical protein CHBEV_106 [Choristoneura biennis entomopoxvirus]
MVFDVFNGNYIFYDKNIYPTCNNNLIIAFIITLFIIIFISKYYEFIYQRYSHEWLFKVMR